ncbi:MAG: sigma-70 family RNA polymerase sigma factor [bacterium]|nr:sigma-70 family RNA polymerase sigma factor [bacterium]
MLRTEEKELVRRTLDGDPDAFGNLYRTHRSRIYATVRGRTPDLEDVEDLVQVTFIRAFLGLSGFRGDAAFSTWLTQIAMNLCTSHHRSQKALSARLDTVSNPGFGLRDTWEPARIENPEEALSRKESRDHLVQCIQRLPSPYREVMVLRYLEDRSYLEITRALQVPIGTVKSWLYRARQQMEEHLKGTDLLHS